MTEANGRAAGEASAGYWKVLEPYWDPFVARAAALYDSLGPERQHFFDALGKLAASTER